MNKRLITFLILIYSIAAHPTGGDGVGNGGTGIMCESLKDTFTNFHYHQTKTVFLLDLFEEKSSFYSNSELELNKIGSSRHIYNKDLIYEELTRAINDIDKKKFLLDKIEYSQKIQLELNNIKKAIYQKNIFIESVSPMTYFSFDTGVMAYSNESTHSHRCYNVQLFYTWSKGNQRKYYIFWENYKYLKPFEIKALILHEILFTAFRETFQDSVAIRQIVRDILQDFL